MTTAIPKIVVGEHTITIEHNGQQQPLSPDEFENLTTPLPDSPADEYFTGGALKAVGEQGEVGGYLVVWGSPAKRDLQGEYFTPQTEMRLDYYNERPVLYHHGLGEADSIKIGEIFDLTKDDTGLFARARLFLHDPDPEVKRFAATAWHETKAGHLFWSSGSLGHLVETAPDGQILKWPLVEGSLTPAPAEPERTKVDAIKQAIQQLGTSTDPAPIEPAAKEASDDVPNPTDTKDPVIPKSKTRKRGTKMLNMEQIEVLREKGLDDSAILSVIGVLSESEGAGEPVALMAEHEDDEEEDEEEVPFRSETEDVPDTSNGKPPPTKSNGASPEMIVLQEQVTTLRGVVRRMKTAPPPDDATPPGRKGKGEHYKGITHRVASKYDGLSAMDLAFLKSVMDGTPEVQKRGGSWVPDDPEAYYKALAIKTEDEKIIIPPALAERFAAIKANGLKADELNYSTQSSFGDEFVPTLWRSQLWRTPRLDNAVFANSISIEMPSNPYTVPIEGGDPTVYAVGETTDESTLLLSTSSSIIPDSKIGTSNTTLTAAKLALRVMLAEELNEDSIIPIIALWREQAVREMEDARDAVILSADDSTGSSNINYDGTSATTSVAAVSRFLYGGGDGYLHLCLITDKSGLAVDMGNAAPTLAKIREARGKLNRSLFQKRNDLRYYCDPETLLKLESLDEAIVTSINGVGSTFEGRELKAIDGITVHPTAEMSLGTSTGVVSATGGNNTRGRLLLVHVPSWYVGFRREVRVNFDYMPVYDAHILIVTMRMALGRRAADVASLLYNIAV